MSEIITKIERKKGFVYKIDKDGYVIKENYSIFKDPKTLITLAIIFLSVIYYIQIKSMKTTEANFEESCLKYVEWRNLWMTEHPGKLPTLKEVMDYGTLIEEKRLRNEGG